MPLHDRHEFVLNDGNNLAKHFGMFDSVTVQPPNQFLAGMHDNVFGQWLGESYATSICASRPMSRVLSAN